MVIIIDHDEVSQLQVSCCASSFTRNTFHCTPIAKETKSMIVDYIIPRLVEYRSRVSLGNGKTNRIRETLTQRASCDLYARRIMNFRVARSDAVQSLSGRTDVSRTSLRHCIHGTHPKGFQVIQGHFIAKQMEQRIYQHASMAIPIRERIFSPALTHSRKPPGKNPPLENVSNYTSRSHMVRHHRNPVKKFSLTRGRSGLGLASWGFLD